MKVAYNSAYVQIETFNFTFTPSKRFQLAGSQDTDLSCHLPIFCFLLSYVITIPNVTTDGRTDGRPGTGRKDVKLVA